MHPAGPVQEVVHLHQGLFHSLAPQVQAGGCLRRGDVLGHRAGGILLFQLALAQQADVLQGHPGFDDARLDQHGAVLGQLQHGGLLIDVVEEHLVPHHQGPRQHVVVVPPLVHRVGGAFQLFQAGAQPGFLLGGALPCLLDDLGCLLPGAVYLLFGLGLGLVFQPLGGLGVCLGLGGGGPQGFQLVLHFAAVLLQAAHHLLKCVALPADQLPGTVHNGGVHAQALGDGKGVGLARHADEQPVGGPQGGHVELAAAVLHLHAGCLDGVGLQLGVVGGAGQAHATAPQLLDDSLRQGGALHRVGTGAQLVQEDETAVVRHLEDVDDVHHVGGEGGERLLNALLVADVPPPPGCPPPRESSGRTWP